MKELSLIYPPQLFEEHPALKKGRDVFIVEDPLFFGDAKYPLKFHKMKLTFHRASMKVYAEMLKKRKFNVSYIDYSILSKDTNSLFRIIIEKKYESIHVCEPDDFILNKRILRNCNRQNLHLVKYRNPSFINEEDYLKEYFSNKKSYFQHYFYIDQRKKHDVMVDNGSPVEGKWSFDSENRKSIPKDLKIPGLLQIASGSKFVEEAKKYINKNFPHNPGENEDFYIPIDFKTSKEWLNDFLKQKLIYFGDYQDAI
jgi:deoxyribodipyrimidine photolyase-related protein